MRKIFLTSILYAFIFLTNINQAWAVGNLDCHIQSKNGYGVQLLAGRFRTGCSLATDLEVRITQNKKTESFKIPREEMKLKCQNGFSLERIDTINKKPIVKLGFLGEKNKNNSFSIQNDKEAMTANGNSVNCVFQ